MASPIGHAAVGVAAAAVVGAATHTVGSSVFWIGAVIASGVPDLDVLFPLLGFSKRFHRNASHSLFIISVEILAGWVLARALAPGLAGGVLLAWAAALASHPLLDVITTGPTLGKIGWGIPLFWPLSRKRFFVTWPVLGDRDEGLTVSDTLREMGDDIMRVVPVCAVIVVIVWLQHPASFAGVWKGDSVCLADKPICKDEIVVYHVTALDSANRHFSMQASKLVNGQEEDMGTLACGGDERGTTLRCDMPPGAPAGVWEFTLRGAGDQLEGGLTLAGGTRMRQVKVFRQRPPI